MRCTAQTACARTSGAGCAASRTQRRDQLVRGPACAATLPATTQALRSRPVSLSRLIGVRRNTSAKRAGVSSSSSPQRQRRHLGPRRQQHAPAGPGKTVPRADLEADVAAVDAVPDARPQFARNHRPGSRSSDRRCTGAHRPAPGAESPASGRHRGTACICRTAGRPGPRRRAPGSLRLQRLVGLEFHAGQDRREQQPVSKLAARSACRSSREIRGPPSPPSRVPAPAPCRHSSDSRLRPPRGAPPAPVPPPPAPA